MSSHILRVTCLTDNFPDGQKITGARLQYDRPIDGRWITPAAFWAKDHQITGITVDGDKVTLSFDIMQPVASLIPAPGPRPSSDKPVINTPPKGPMGGPPRNLPAAERRAPVVEVAQISDIKAVDGTILPPDENTVISTEAYEPVVSDFEQAEYEGIPYNLYIPKEYDGTNSLPLVMFIHDAGPCGPDPKITLSQGSGAISFASPEWQAEHPCFVLAPQIDRKVHLTNDGFQASEELFTIKALLDDVVERYNVDKKRVYTTGQSMGCMASCELNIRYPDYFAASLLVAGQWSPERMAEQCTGCKFWILVSEHDAKAFPGMNAVTEALEGAGVKIGRYWWDAKESAEQLSEYAREAMKDDVPVRYTVFHGSSVVPAHRIDNPGTNHVCTWNVVYPIKGLREWLFSIAKD